MHIVSSGGYYGAERAIVELSLGLTNNGWNSLILALDSRGEPSLVECARLHQIATIDVETRSSLRSLRRAIDRTIDAHDVDIVHSHGYKGDLLVATLPRRRTVRRVATCHGWITTSVKLAAYETLDKICLRRFDRIAAVSAPIRDSLVRWGNGVDRVTLVDNGVDVPTPNADARERVRAALGLTSGQHLVLVVGRLDRGKGVADVVHAVGRLLEAGHDIVLAVAGEGEEGKRLTQLAESLGIGGRVHLLGYRSDVGDLLVATDVFVIASYSEGLPIALIEAMALARPVVATRVGEIANALEGERGGLLLDPGDIDALGAAIESVVTRPDGAQQRVTAALRRYGARYSRAAMAQRYLELYATLF